MSDQDLMIPEASSVPAYIKNAEAASAANEAAAAGISTGFPPRVKLSGKAFALIDGNGEETAYPPAKLVKGPDDNLYLPMITLTAKKALSKTWYAGAYSPDAENVSPDCFSNNSERPDPSVTTPQSDTCAMCPMNAWGSGTDQDGNPTKGKACSDTKLLAVLVPGFGVHSFKLPPASLKNFGLYLKQLTTNNIPLDRVYTLVGFDLTTTYPVLVFRFGGYVKEKDVPTLEKLASSPETEEAIGGITASAPKQVEAPAAEKAPVVEKTPEPEKTAPAQQEVVADDLGLGLDDPPAQEEAKTDPTAVPTDDELADFLDIPLT